MKTEEKVRIEIEGAPIIRLQKGKPVAYKYKIVPRFCPALRNSFKQTTWKHATRKLILSIEETSEFDAFNWISSMNDRRREAQRGPFADLEQDALALILVDHVGTEIAGYKFLNLELRKHEVNLYQQKLFGVCQQSDETTLTHHVTIYYHDFVKLDLEKPRINSSLAWIDPQNLIDEEWKTVVSE